MKAKNGNPYTVKASDADLYGLSIFMSIIVAIMLIIIGFIK